MTRSGIAPRLADDDLRGLARYVDWSPVNAFNLAIVEAETRRDTARLLGWLQSRAGCTHVRLSAAGGLSTNPWQALAARAGADGDVLVLTGLDDLVDAHLQALNIQRDELTRALSRPWIIILPAETRRRLELQAPDFTDFAGFWALAPPLDPTEVEAGDFWSFASPGRTLAVEDEAVVITAAGADPAPLAEALRARGRRVVVDPEGAAGRAGRPSWRSAATLAVVIGPDWRRDDAGYAHDEVARAVARARDADQGFRVVPVLLGEWSAAELPRGLGRVAPLHVPDGDWAAAAERLDAASKQGPSNAGPGRFVDDGPRVSLGRLPAVGPYFFGRAEALAALDASWRDAAVGLHTIIGVGGEGKSTLVQRWLDRLGPDFGGAERVYGWSFYAQGDRAERQSSADLFINQLLEWLGDPDPNLGDPWQKGRRLAGLVRARRMLLILDGLEPLQDGPGANAGCIRDPALATLLRDLRADNPGLVVSTSRQPLVELGQSGPVVEHRLPPLDPADGARLLRAHGLVGGDGELEAASAEFRGHALALHLLGGYLAAYEQGDVRRRDRVGSIFEAEDGGGHARRVMKAYDRKLGEPERQVLRLLGLFDREADGPALDALLAAPAVAGLNDALGPRAGEGWQRAVEYVADLGLVSRAGDGLDAHPLVRAAFGEMLGEEAEAAWVEGHRRLFEHFQRGPELPDTLEGLEPLYRAVRHGCLAGRHVEALELLIWRIQRGDEYFATRVLCAHAASLNALRHLFEVPWQRLRPGLPRGGKGWVYGQVSFALRALGRLAEAVSPTASQARMSAKRHEWTNAARAARNLGEILLALGRLDSGPRGSSGDNAISSAHRAVRYAARTRDRAEQNNKCIALAHILFQRGHLSEAERFFAIAGQPGRVLQSPMIADYRYIDFVFSTGSPTAQPVAQRLLNTPMRQASGHLVHGLHKILHGRAVQMLTSDSSPAKWRSARAHFDQAVLSLRRARQKDLLPLGLLARAALNRDTRDWQAARDDLAEAREIAEQGQMRLHLADVHLETARLELARQRPDAARPAYAAAVALVEATQYHRRDDEIVALAEALGLTPPPWVGRSDIMVDLPIPKAYRRKTRKRLKKRKR